MEQDYVRNISPTEFEEHCLQILSGYAEEDKLKDFSITHDIKIPSSDGTYQIDVYAEFSALGVRFKVLCECKQYSSPISREKVVILHDKVKSIGAHKGILLATSSFQSGAIQYAKAHGIALIQMFDANEKSYSFSTGSSNCQEFDPYLYSIQKMPHYRAINLISGATVFPTRSLILSIYKEINMILNGEWDFIIQKLEGNNPN